MKIVFLLANNARGAFNVRHSILNFRLKNSRTNRSIKTLYRCISQKLKEKYLNLFFRMSLSSNL
jgi:hypothetical protein